MSYRIPEIELTEKQWRYFDKKFAEAFNPPPKPEPEPVQIEISAAVNVQVTVEVEPVAYRVAAMPISEEHCLWDTEYFKSHSPYEFGDWHRRKVAGNWELRTEAVTPHRAKTLLAIPGKRQAWPEDVIVKIAKGMAEGRWRWRTLPVKLRDDGAVVSGSLYLESCVRARTTVYLPIIYGVVEDIIPVKVGRGNGRRLSPEQVREIRALSQAGQRVVDIAKKFGVSRCSIYNILAGRKRADVA